MGTSGRALAPPAEMAAALIRDPDGAGKADSEIGAHAVAGDGDAVHVDVTEIREDRETDLGAGDVFGAGAFLALDVGAGDMRERGADADEAPFRHLAGPVERKVIGAATFAVIDDDGRERAFAIGFDQIAAERAGFGRVGPLLAVQLEGRFGGRGWYRGGRQQRDEEKCGESTESGGEAGVHMRFRNKEARGERHRGRTIPARTRRATGLKRWIVQGMYSMISLGRFSDVPLLPE